MLALQANRPWPLSYHCFLLTASFLLVAAPAVVTYPSTLGMQVLGKMPDKTFNFHRTENKLLPLALPAGTTAAAALQRVLRLPSVCSKRFLTNKVDRHVTGVR